MKTRAMGLGKVLAYMAAAWLGCQTVSATLVVADFNDVTAGPLTNKTGGTGFTAAKWTLSGKPQVVGGNLSCPLYTRSQTGTACSVQTASSLGGPDSQADRVLATPLTGDGVSLLGVCSYGGLTFPDGGIIDNVRISNVFYAFNDVTGIPRPAGTVFKMR